MAEEQANAHNALVEKWLAIPDSIFEVYREAARARREADININRYQNLVRICAKCLRMLNDYEGLEER